MSNKITFEPKYKIGQTVYTINIYTNGFYYVDKCTVKAYVYNGDNFYYILGDKYHPCYNEVWYREDGLYLKYSDAVAEKNKINNMIKGGNCNG